MITVYDAGVLVAADRHDRDVWADHQFRLARGESPVTTAPVVAQVSRAGTQARLRMFLNGCTIVPFAVDEAHAVGRLLARSGASDVVDAHLVQVSIGREILTSDPTDIEALAEHVTPRPAVRRS